MRNYLATDDASWQGEAMMAEIHDLQQQVAALTAERDDLRRKLDISTALRDTLMLENERIGGVEVNLIEAVADALQRENADLRRQLAQTWQPCEDGAINIGWDTRIDINSNLLAASGSVANGEYATVYLDLPVDLRLCRRTPPQEEQPHGE